MDRLTKHLDGGRAMWNRGPDISHPGYTLGTICEKLCGLEDAVEEWAPLLDLPKLGEEIYKVYECDYEPPRIIKWNVRNLKINNAGCVYIGVGNRISLNADEIGKTLFLTREDAEEKIRKLAGEIMEE